MCAYVCTYVLGQNSEMPPLSPRPGSCPGLACHPLQPQTARTLWEGEQTKNVKGTWAHYCDHVGQYSKMTHYMVQSMSHVGGA